MEMHCRPPRNFTELLCQPWCWAAGWLAVWLALAATGRAESVIERISISTAGRSGFADSGPAAVSADGRFVAFASFSGELVLPETSFGLREIFVQDRATGQLERASVPVDVARDVYSGIDNDCSSPSISADGRFVVFSSLANNLTAIETSNIDQIYLFDRQTRKTSMVSVRPDGRAANDSSVLAAISGNGRFVAFTSFASDLVPDDLNGRQDVFVRDLAARKTIRVSVAPDGTETNAPTASNGVPRLSFDGRSVVFASTASDLVADDLNGTNSDVFVRDLKTGTTTLASVVPNAATPARRAFQPDISADGRLVGYGDFTTAFSDANPTTLNGAGTVRLFDRATGASIFVAATSSEPRLSADGSKVALVQVSAGNNTEVKVVNRTTGSTIFAVPRLGATNNLQTAPALSADGRLVAFTTPQALTSNDTNGDDDVYATPLHDVLALEQAVYRVSENGGSVVVRVRRIGESLGALTVQRAVSAPGDTAAPGLDYNFPAGGAVGTLSWAAGDDSERTIVIPLLNRAGDNGYRSLAVTLNSPTGGAALGLARTTVLIRDLVSEPIEDSAGHGLKITKLVNRGTDWFAQIFRAEFTVQNPAPTPSFALRLDFLFQQLDKNTRQPVGLPFVVDAMNIAAVPGAASTAFVAQGDISGGAQGDNIDGILFVRLVELTPEGGEVIQDTAFCTNYDTSDKIPPQGGVTQPNAGLDAPGFTPIRIASVTVNPATPVNENSTGNFTAAVKLSDGTTLANVSAAWKTSKFAINAAGVLTTGEVTKDTAITVTATVTRQGQTVSGSRTVTVKNVPAPPVITSGLTAFASVGKPFSYKIVAVHEPTSFAATGLPDGLSVNAKTGAITGSATLPDGVDAQTFNVQITAANEFPGSDTETLVLLVSRPSPLTVSLTGTGTVTGIGVASDPFPRVEARDVGRMFTLTAKAGTNSLFDGWHGDLTSPSPKFTFLMTPNLDLEARFVPNVYLTLGKAGAYAGFLAATPVAHGSSGTIQVTVGALGGFTGKLALGGQRYKLKGVLAPNGTTAPLAITRPGLPPLTVTLALDVLPGFDLLNATVGDGSFVTGTQARRVLNAAGALEGRYTVLLPTGIESDGLPQGVGYGALTVSAKAAIKLAATLGDGTVVSLGGPLTAGGIWPLYAALYGGGGSLGGPVEFANLAASDLSGDLTWFKPAKPTDAFYPEGWPSGLAAALRGSRYAGPPVFPGLGATGAGGNARLTAHGGGLLGDQGQLFDLATTGGVTLLAPLLEKFTLSFTAATGLYKGSVFDPSAGVSRSFGGAVLQKSEEAQGTFKGGAKRTGSANVTAVP